ncbi:hypothetical protein [Sporosarcina sp. SAFN-015]|uniref:hypothetical protein n=1 Tax=Sporosarcina sp. SAFN-015 TaxID=3387274 RepID=UPI003F819CAD
MNSAIATFLMPGFAIAGGLIAEWGISVNHLFIGAGIWVLLLSLFFLFDPDLRDVQKVSGEKVDVGDVAVEGE